MHLVTCFSSSTVNSASYALSCFNSTKQSLTSIISNSETFLKYHEIYFFFALFFCLLVKVTGVVKLGITRHIFTIQLQIARFSFSKNLIFHKRHCDSARIYTHLYRNKHHILYLCFAVVLMNEHRLSILSGFFVFDSSI